jgi:leucyl-tRNA synthetase
MFAAPPEQTLEWSDAGVEGAHRFLKRLWSFAATHQVWLTVQNPQDPACPSDAAAKDLRRSLHELLKQADFDLTRRQYNTVVSACMKMLNTLEDAVKATGQPSGDLAAVLHEGLGLLIRILYPVVPHICCYLWDTLGYSRSQGNLLDAPWPQVDEQALVRDSIELMLQINGKLRGSLTVSADADSKAIEAAALASEAFAKFSEGKPLRKAIVVPGRLVNLVV